jgi:transposase
MPSRLRLPNPSRLHLSGCRLSAKPSASGSWPRLPGAVSGANTQPVKDAVVKKPADNVTLSAAEGEAMIARLAVYAPSRSDCEILVQVVRWYFWLVWTVQEAKLSLKKLRTLLFGQGPKPPTLLCEPAASAVSASSRGDSEVSGDGSARDEEVGWSTEAEATPASVAAAVETRKPRGGHRPGTGRLGADAYKGAERVECRHEELAPGQRCPVCGQGTLYALPPSVEIRIDGQGLLSAMRYELDKLRCSACGQIFTAELPDGVGEEKYSTRARAVLAVSRYYLGLPGYRVQGYQAMLGVPVPDATQWDQIEQVGDCAYVVFEQMEQVAAQGELIFHDDTAVRIVSLLQENSALFAAAQAPGVSTPTERTGMHTTALVVKVGEHTAILYDSSRRHAGENLQGLLDKREAGLAKPLAMSDALTSNVLTNEAAVIRCHCLAHGRRKFSDLEDVFPQECQVVLQVLSQVFDHDEQARKEQLSPLARLAYHQAQSQPLMDGLKRWLDTQLDEHLVEPNSALGKAMGYMQRHWVTLTRFLSVPGAPLDNNLAERALKLFIRQRKNSLFYKNTHSAYIASVLTSLIATCIYAGGNAVEYLVALQEHRSEVCADPAAWLPWAYARSRASP